MEVCLLLNGDSYGACWILLRDPEGNSSSRKGRPLPHSE
jgi:hypothetical protein